ncbi:hypothetical protein [Peribacillus sp. NPDC096448]|uniref:hypothetical protein n=1 Tax=Peribacillus sp. NPDC096448 TaxID=3364395 RepID=UPI003819A88B
MKNTDLKVYKRKSIPLQALAFHGRSGEPPRRFAPLVSPLDTLFPQESRTFRSNQFCFEILDDPFFSTVLLGKRTSISTPGTRFPRAVGEPSRRLVPAVSSLDALFPQESRTFRSNQFCFEILGEPLLFTVSNHQSGGLFLCIISNIRYIFLYIETSSRFKRKNKDMHVFVFQQNWIIQPLRKMDLVIKEGQQITVP